MKTAWIEDTLGLVPPIMFPVAAHMDRNAHRSRRFPFGFERVNGLGFFVAAVALAAVGALLLYNALWRSAQPNMRLSDRSSFWATISGSAG